MALVLCKYQKDCVAGREYRGHYICTILNDSTFKNNICPFYKSRKAYYYDEYFERWLKKNGEK